jgi:hypothetical protein
MAPSTSVNVPSCIHTPRLTIDLVPFADGSVFVSVVSVAAEERPDGPSAKVRLSCKRPTLNDALYAIGLVVATDMDSSGKVPDILLARHNCDDIGAGSIWWRHLRDVFRPFGHSIGLVP